MLLIDRLFQPQLEPKNSFKGEGRYLLQYVVNSVSQSISQPDELMMQNSDTTSL